MNTMSRRASAPPGHRLPARQYPGENPPALPQPERAPRVGGTILMPLSPRAAQRSAPSGRSRRDPATMSIRPGFSIDEDAGGGGSSGGDGTRARPAPPRQPARSGARDIRPCAGNYRRRSNNCCGRSPCRRATWAITGTIGETLKDDPRFRLIAPEAARIHPGDRLDPAGAELLGSTVRSTLRSTVNRSRFMPALIGRAEIIARWGRETGYWSQRPFHQSP